MTENVPVEELDLPAKLLQASTTNEVPAEFILDNNNANVDVSNMPYLDAPIIDFTLLLSSSSAAQELELDKLHSSLTSWGCFQLINHGMPSSFLDMIRETTKQFFTLPLEEKKMYARPTVNDVEGYGGDILQRNNDWLEQLHLTAGPKEKRNLQYWPHNPFAFRPLLNEFTIKSGAIFNAMLKSAACSLKLEENSFLKHYGENGLCLASFNYYPHCPRPDLTLGQKEHADGAMMTILIQDEEVEGLQVQKDEQWFKVPIISDAVFVIIGDQMEVISDGKLKAPNHRVVTNSEKDRVTVAMFAAPDPEAELIGEDRPQLMDRSMGMIHIKPINMCRKKYLY